MASPRVLGHLLASLLLAFPGNIVLDYANAHSVPTGKGGRLQFKRACIARCVSLRGATGKLAISPAKPTTGQF